MRSAAVLSALALRDGDNEATLLINVSKTIQLLESCWKRKCSYNA